MPTSHRSAIESTDCPRCQALAGNACVRLGREPLPRGCHAVRLAAYRKAHPPGAPAKGGPETIAVGARVSVEVHAALMAKFPDRGELSAAIRPMIESLASDGE